MIGQIKSAIVNDHLADVAGMSLGLAIHYVLDGDTFEDLEGCQKTFIGTKFEKNFVKALGLPRGQDCLLDTVIAGHDVDIKLTVGKNWMIPPECVGHACILCKVNYDASTFSLGLFKADIDNLTKGSNRDMKRSVSAAGQKTIEWVLTDSPILGPSSVCQTKCQCGAIPRTSLPTAS